MSFQSLSLTQSRHVMPEAATFFELLLHFVFFLNLTHISYSLCGSEISPLITLWVLDFPQYSHSNKQAYRAAAARPQVLPPRI